MATGRKTSIFTFTAPNIVLVRHQLSQLNSQKQTHLERRLLGKEHKEVNYDPASYVAQVLEHQHDHFFPLSASARMYSLALLMMLLELLLLLELIFLMLLTLLKKV